MRRTKYDLKKAQGSAHCWRPADAQDNTTSHRIIRTSYDDAKENLMRASAWTMCSTGDSICA